MQYKEPEIFKPDYKELEKLVLKYDLTIYRRILVVEQYKLTLINRNESLLRARHNFSVLL